MGELSESTRVEERSRHVGVKGVGVYRPDHVRDVQGRQLRKGTIGSGTVVCGCTVTHGA